MGNPQRKLCRLTESSQHEELRRRVRGLTTVLYKFISGEQLSKQPRSADSLLLYVATLLTCGDQCDNEAKKVISVAASVELGVPVRILVVAQNTHVRSSVETISLKVVEERHSSLDEVVTGPANRDFLGHVSDVQAALSAFDARATNVDDQLRALEVFFLSRSFPKFVARFNEDTRLCCGKRLFEVIRQWKPSRSRRRREIPLPKLVNWPDWLIQLEALPPIPSKLVNGEVKCEFSDDTKRIWSEVLVAFLVGVDKAIGDVMLARDKGDKGEEEAHRAMFQLNYWCRMLYDFVYWDAGIVPFLLTKTTMLNDMVTPTMLHPEIASTLDDDESAELRFEPGERKGPRVLRYLERVLAWHEALDTLCSNKITPGLLKNIIIGVIEVPRFLSSAMTLPEICDEFFVRFSHMMIYYEPVVETLANHSSDAFLGCVHAEATLMGILNYYGHYSAHASQDAGIQNPWTMQQVVQPITEAEGTVIAVSKKCCWCCNWLSQNLESKFTLPGTHGVIYPWDPPKVGVSETVLKRLEDKLWEKLYAKVLSFVPIYTFRSDESPKWCLTDPRADMSGFITVEFLPSY